MGSPALDLLAEAALTQYGKRINIFHALAHPLWVKLTQQAEVSLFQTFKPYILELEALGLQVSEKPGESDLVLFIPSKDKKQSLAWMAEAFTHLPDGGKLMIACENRYGAKSYEAALQKLAGNITSTSRSKCRLFSAQKTADLHTELQQQWLDDAQPKVIESHGLWAQAGLFSWKKADMGSQLLLQYVPELSGKVMDLCCGYGLLAVHIARHGEGISALHMVDAEGLALACARKNMAGFAPAHYHHLDASCETLPQGMDTVVCNPPFHTGQARDVALGLRIVEQACAALGGGGSLYMVANRKLPYEKVLAEHLSEVRCLVEDNGFKVLGGKK